MIKTLYVGAESNARMVLDASQDIPVFTGGFVVEAAVPWVVVTSGTASMTIAAVPAHQGDIARKLPRASHVFCMSRPSKGQGIVPMLKVVDGAYEAAMTKLATPKLTRLLLDRHRASAAPVTMVSVPRCASAWLNCWSSSYTVLHLTMCHRHTAMLSGKQLQEAQIAWGRCQWDNSSRPRTPLCKQGLKNRISHHRAACRTGWRCSKQRLYNYSKLKTIEVQK